MRNKQQTQIKLQRLLQETHSHTNDKHQTELHYQLAQVIAQYKNYKEEN